MNTLSAVLEMSFNQSHLPKYFSFHRSNRKPHYIGGRFGLYCQKTQSQTGAAALAHRQNCMIWFLVNGLELSSSLEKSG